MRLVGQESTTKGTIQICFDNAWGSVCDDSWGLSDANVVCGQLGHSNTGKRPCTMKYHVYLSHTVSA